MAFADLTQLLNNWGACANLADPCPDLVTPCPWDTDGPGGTLDRIVGFADLTKLLNNWGPCK